MNVKIEMTDLFAGEANYSWVKRRTIEMPDFATTRSVVRAVKKELGIDRRHTTNDYGDRLVIHPRRSGTVIFVDFTA